MKKMRYSLCTLALSLVLAVCGRAENSERSELWEIFPGECYLDGLISPPHKSISDMEGFEVPLVAVWSPINLEEGTHYRGDAKFGVHNFKIAGGELIDSYTVDINLNPDDPGLSEEERHNLFIYSCNYISGGCTATLATVKGAITEQIARDHKIEVEDVTYENNSSVNFLGVFVKGMTSLEMREGGKSGQIYLQTEVCGTNEIIMAKANSKY